MKHDRHRSSIAIQHQFRNHPRALSKFNVFDMTEIEKLKESYAKYLHGVETDWSGGCYLGGTDVDKMCVWLDLAYKIGEVDALKNALDKAKLLVE